GAGAGRRRLSRVMFLVTVTRDSRSSLDFGVTAGVKRIPHVVPRLPADTHQTLNRVIHKHTLRGRTATGPAGPPGHPTAGGRRQAPPGATRPRAGPRAPCPPPRAATGRARPPRETAPAATGASRPCRRCPVPGASPPTTSSPLRPAVARPRGSSAG